MAPAAAIDAPAGGRKDAAAPPKAVAGADVGQQASYTLEEVAKHNTPEDCWVIVRGDVYDVTAWVPRHPGGPLIYVRAGGDCTQLFDSYHPLSARKTLEKYRIGRVALRGGESLTDYEGGSDFYETLRGRVEKYFRDNKLNPRIAPAMYVKTAVIFASLAATFYAAFFYCTSFPAALLAAAALGIAMGEVGVSIQHDANHGAYAPSRALCVLMGASLDVVGASSFMWRQQHVIGHHAYTNVDGLDPDIRVHDPDIRRVTPGQPWQKYQERQHVYLGFLYGLLAIKSVLVDDFAALRSGFIGSVKLAKLAPWEAAVFWGGKALFAAWFVGLPALYSHWGWAQLAALWVFSELVTGWFLAFMFQVAHVTGDVTYLERDAATGKVPMDWAASQVATTADFSHGSWLWTHLSGGLNHQVVHHLFPGVCHVHYPALAPIVAETCKQYGIKYHVYPTFWAALAAHFKHLKSVGAGAGLASKIPSLATVG